MRLIPRSRRGVILHQAHTYGLSRNQAPLDIYLPANSQVELLVIGGIHGDEPETVVLLSEALRSIAPADLQTAVILSANPDGARLGTRASSAGVDLNRNFPARNWSPEKVYHRGKAGDPQDIELSPGTSGGSEPETTALIKIIDELQPRIIVALHSALACVDDPENTALGTWLASATGLTHQPDIGYSTPGSLGSWCVDHELPLVTFELPPESLVDMKTTTTPLLIKLITGQHPG